MASFVDEYGPERGKALCDLMLVRQGFMPPINGEDASIMQDVADTYGALSAAGAAPLTDDERARVAMTLRRVIDGANAAHEIAISNARSALTDA